MRFCVVGLGITQLGHVPGKSIMMLETEAARLAIADAGLHEADIDGAIQLKSDIGGGMRMRQDDAFPRMLGLPIKFYMENVGRGGENVAKAFLMAEQLLRRGICEYVVCSGARDDWSRSRKYKKAGRRGTPYIHKENAFGAMQGDSPPGFHGLLATRHMHLYGTTSRQLGHIAVAQRLWACLNPAAFMHDHPITIEDHQNSPIVAWPYHLLDICLQSDGGTAFVLTTENRAKDLKKPPVYVSGIGFGEHLQSLYWDKRHYSELPIPTARDAAFGQAGITLADVDVAQFYDCFTTEVLLQLEGYGYCGIGEGGPFVETRGMIGPDGKIKFNTGGGLLSSHHLGNITTVSEAVIQVRGEGGDRQVPDVEVAIASGHGGEILSGQMCSIHSTTVLTRSPA
jgi:acetyl-CoA acetyltransferase